MVGHGERGGPITKTFIEHFDLLPHALELDLAEHADLRELDPRERHDDDAADALPAGEDEELAVERGMLTDDEAVASSADSDVDFTTSADASECKVPARPMQKLPAGWITPAHEWAADVADTTAPGDAIVALPGSSDGATPPDPM